MKIADLKNNLINNIKYLGMLLVYLMLNLISLVLYLVAEALYIVLAFLASWVLIVYINRTVFNTSFISDPDTHHNIFFGTVFVCTLFLFVLHKIVKSKVRNSLFFTGLFLSFGVLIFFPYNVASFAIDCFKASDHPSVRIAFLWARVVFLFPTLAYVIAFINAKAFKILFIINIVFAIFIYFEMWYPSQVVLLLEKLLN